MQQEQAAGNGASSERASALGALQRQARAPVGFVAASTSTASVDAPVQPIAAANPDEIELDV